MSREGWISVEDRLPETCRVVEARHVFEGVVRAQYHREELDEDCVWVIRPGEKTEPDEFDSPRACTLEIYCKRCHEWGSSGVLYSMPYDPQFMTPEWGYESAGPVAKSLMTGLGQVGDETCEERITREVMES